MMRFLLRLEEQVISYHIAGESDNSDSESREGSGCHVAQLEYRVFPPRVGLGPRVAVQWWRLGWVSHLFIECHAVQYQYMARDKGT